MPMPELSRRIENIERRILPASSGSRPGPGAALPWCACNGKLFVFLEDGQDPPSSPCAACKKPVKAVRFIEDTSGLVLNK